MIRIILVEAHNWLERMYGSNEELRVQWNPAMSKISAPI